MKTTQTTIMVRTTISKRRPTKEERIHKQLEEIMQECTGLKESDEQQNVVESLSRALKELNKVILNKFKTDEDGNTE